MELTRQEQELIHFIRTLEFDDILDATDGIKNVAKNALVMASKKSTEGDLYNADSFREQAYLLDKLSDILGDANADFRFHIYPENEDGADFEETEIEATRLRRRIRELETENETWHMFNETLVDIICKHGLQAEYVSRIHHLTEETHIENENLQAEINRKSFKRIK